MLIGYVGSSETSATSSNFNGTATISQANNPQPLPHDSGNLARLVSEYAFDPGGSSAPSNSAPSSTFGSNPNPPYDPNAPADLSSSNGRVAANGLLRMEHVGIGETPQAEAQIMAQMLAQHKNDPQFLQQYLGTLGSGRVAQMFSYLASPGNIQTPFNSLSGASSPQQVKQQYQDMASALSTLVKNKDFSQSDMNQFVAEFAKTAGPVNFFAKDVLSSASPQVSKMFFESAKNYALQNPGSSAGQSMAAYAMQALSQTSNPLPQLESLPGNQLSTLVTAAMQGEAAYGNPPTIDQYARTGIFRAQNGQGDPLNGLTNLMFNAAYADVGDQFSPAPLSTSKAQNLMTNMFQAAVTTLQNDPTVKSFCTENVPSEGVSMKDALAVDFQNGYDSIINSRLYTEPNGTLSQAGLDGLREFFSDAIFTSPPSQYASSVVQMMQQKFGSYITEANNNPSAKPDFFSAVKLGEEAQTMAAGLQESFTSILNGSQQADQDTKNLIGSLITVGEAAGGAAGPEGAVGAAIVGEALRLAVGSGNPDPSEVAAEANQLIAEGINVNGYTSGGLLNLQGQDNNPNFWSPFNQGVSTAQYGG